MCTWESQVRIPVLTTAVSASVTRLVVVWVPRPVPTLGCCRVVRSDIRPTLCAITRADKVFRVLEKLFNITLHLLAGIHQSLLGSHSCTNTVPLPQISFHCSAVTAGVVRWLAECCLRSQLRCLPGREEPLLLQLLVVMGGGSQHLGERVKVNTSMVRYLYRDFYYHYLCDQLYNYQRLQ